MHLREQLVLCVMNMLFQTELFVEIWSAINVHVLCYTTRMWLPDQLEWRKPFVQNEVNLQFCPLGVLSISLDGAKRWIVSWMVWRALVLLDGYRVENSLVLDFQIQRKLRWREVYRDFCAHSRVCKDNATAYTTLSNGISGRLFGTWFCSAQCLLRWLRREVPC